MSVFCCTEHFYDKLHELKSALVPRQPLHEQSHLLRAPDPRPPRMRRREGGEQLLEGRPLLGELLHLGDGDTYMTSALRVEGFPQSEDAVREAMFD